MTDIMTTTNEMEKQTVADALNLQTRDDIRANEHNISRLLEYAKTQGATDKVTLLAEISTLRNRLGNPSIGEMSAWAYLALERQSIVKKKEQIDATMKKFEKTPKRDDKGKFL